MTGLSQHLPNVHESILGNLNQCIYLYFTGIFTYIQKNVILVLVRVKILTGITITNSKVKSRG